MRITSLAKLVSQVAHPVLTFPLCIILLFGAEQAWELLIVVLGFSFGLPFLFFLWLFFSGKITDFDVSDRKQRYPLYASGLVGMLASLAFMYFSPSTFLFNEFLRLFLLAVFMVLINFRVKVSIHTAMATVLSVLLFEFYEWEAWIFLLAPLVAASRLILKRHSWLEVCLGTALPILFYASVLVPAS